MNSKFKIANKKFILSSNEGKNILHGGKVGFSYYPWKKLTGTLKWLSRKPDWYLC